MAAGLTGGVRAPGGAAPRAPRAPAPPRQTYARPGTVITRQGGSVARTQPGALQRYLGSIPQSTQKSTTNPNGTITTTATSGGVTSAAKTNPATLQNYLSAQGLQPSGANAGQPINPPPPTTVDPRDSQYWDQYNRLQFNIANRQASTLAADQTDQAAREAAVKLLDTNLPLQQKADLNLGNKQGLLESGITGQRLGNTETAYAQKRGQTLQRYNGRIAARDQALQSFLSGAPITGAGYLTNAQGRYQKNLEAVQPNDQLATSAPTTPATGGTPAPATPAYRTVAARNSRGQAGTRHIYPGGRNVFVRAAAARRVAQKGKMKQ